LGVVPQSNLTRKKRARTAIAVEPARADVLAVAARIAVAEAEARVGEVPEKAELTRVVTRVLVPLTGVTTIAQPLKVVVVVVAPPIQKVVVVEKVPVEKVARDRVVRAVAVAVDVPVTPKPRPMPRRPMPTRQQLPKRTVPTLHQ
jgi:hypothetical protein